MTAIDVSHHAAASRFECTVDGLLCRADYQLVDSQGATEGTVLNGTAEAIADITSSGETLRANHLRILADGLIHSSQAVLWASRVAEWSAEDRAGYAALSVRLGVSGVPF